MSGITDDQAEAGWRKMAVEFNIYRDRQEHVLAIENNNPLGYGWVASAEENNPESEDHPWRPIVPPKYTESRWQSWSQ